MSNVNKDLSDLARVQSLESKKEPQQSYKS